MQTNTEKRRGFILFGILLVALVLHRCRILNEFAFQYTDEDQTLMWYASTEFCKGRFHEPRFYGQAYNTLLESLVAVPLVASGVPLYRSLPLATSLLALLPYLLLAIFAWCAEKYFSALLLLCLPLSLSLDYHFMTAIPRGFVTGVAVASLASLIAFKAERSKGYFFFGFLSVLSLSVNPNALVMIFPMGVWLWLQNRTKRAFYGWGSAGMAVGISVHGLIQSFYLLHPHVTGQKMWNSPFFSWASLMTGIRHLDNHWGPLAPFIHSGWTILALLLVCTGIFYGCRQYRALIATLAGLGFMVLSLGMSKVHHGCDSVFFHWARMYLALPLFLAIVVLWIEMGLGKHRFLEQKWLYFTIAGAALAFSLHSHICLRRSLTEVLHRVPYHIAFLKVSDVCAECETIRSKADEHSCTLVIFGDRRLNYAFPALQYGRIESLLADYKYEKRTWRIQEEHRKMHRKILIHEAGFKFDRCPPYVVKATIVLNRPRLVLIEMEGESAVQMMEDMGYPVRPFE